MRILIIAIFAFTSSLSLACGESPKNIKLSETTFTDSLAISYGLNCRVHLSVTTDQGVSYRIMQNSDTKIVCVQIIKNDDWDHKQVLCGDDLAGDKNKEAMTLRNKAGEAVGYLDVKLPLISIYSWKGGPNKNLPYLQFDLKDAKNHWEAKAMQNSTTQIGQGDMVSRACTRGMEMAKGAVLDMRGKSLSTTGAGCGSGVEINDFNSGGKTAAPGDGGQN